MLFKFFITQWESSVKNDWTEEVKKNLAEFTIPADLEYIKSKSKLVFEHLVKKKEKSLSLGDFWKSKNKNQN